MQQFIYALAIEFLQRDIFLLNLLARGARLVGFDGVDELLGVAHLDRLGDLVVVLGLPDQQNPVFVMLDFEKILGSVAPDNQELLVGVLEVEDVAIRELDDSLMRCSVNDFFAFEALDVLVVDELKFLLLVVAAQLQEVVSFGLVHPDCVLLNKLIGTMNLGKSLMISWRRTEGLQGA